MALGLRLPSCGPAWSDLRRAARGGKSLTPVKWIPQSSVITLSQPSNTAPTYLDIIAIIDYDEIMQTHGTPPAMSSITIRNLDPSIKERLRVRAAEHGHSMEAEVRRILQTTLKGPARAPASNLYERIPALVE